MSLAVKPYPGFLKVTKAAFLSATVNDDSDPSYRSVKIPQPFSFRSTSAPVLEWVDYPDGRYLRLTAGHTENGITRSFQFVFFVEPTTGQYEISSDSDRVALTYYSNPVTGELHKGDSGTLDLKYSKNEETLEGSFNGLFDHGGESGDELFPISGKFLAYGLRWTKK